MPSEVDTLVKASHAGKVDAEEEGKEEGREGEEEGEWKDKELEPATEGEPPGNQSEDEKPEPAGSSPPRRREERMSSSYTLGVPDPNATFLFALFLMASLSLLYLVLTPWLLWRVAHQPIRLVWTFSLLAGSFMGLWTATLSHTMGLLAVLLRTSYVLMSALTATHYIGHVSGAAVVSLATFYVAALLGYAIAEHRQRAGSEKAAYTVKTTSPFRCQEHQESRDAVFQTLLAQGILTLCAILRMAWLLLHSADNPSNQTPLTAVLPIDGQAHQIAPGTDGRVDQILVVVDELSLESLALVWMWSDFIAIILLKGALVTFDTMFVKVPAAYATTYILSTLLSIAMGKSVGVLVFMLFPIALSGFLGYCLAVYAWKKQAALASSNLSQDRPN